MKQPYQIVICRVGYGFATIPVLAESQEEAEDLALDEAGNHEYSEKTSEYSLADGHDSSESALDSLSEILGELKYLHETGNMRDNIELRSAKIERAEALLRKAGRNL
jgi:hypothetical protein